MLRFIDHFTNDEIVIGVVFDLWPLRGIEHILQGQRMDIELLPEFAQQLDIAQAVHVYPIDL